MIIAEILFVAGGGALGASARFVMSNMIQAWLPTSPFPLGTFCVNLLGCLLMGLAVGFFQVRYDLFAHANARAFLLTGFLGGFTTFSTFSLENAVLLKQQFYGFLMMNVALQLGLGLLATGFGLWLMNRLF